MAVGYPRGSWDATRPVGLEDAARAGALLATRLPEPLFRLAELAYDLAWSWTGGEELFRCIDPRRWDHLSHNPVRMLLETPVPVLERAARSAELLARIDSLLECLNRDRLRPCVEGPSFGPRRPIAFLCAEFGVHRSLPVYSGGLGVLAGDVLKEASDRALPFLGVSLYYRQGYFHQRMDASGWQHEYWIDHVPELRPLALVHGADGEPLTIEVPIRGRDVVFQVWRAGVGRTSLYLLDANRTENRRWERWITARLYESSPEVRLAQYAALGIGGVRLLRALGVEPGVLHLNEGHAAFAVFELLREGVQAGLAPAAALQAARQRIVFTTHTPVAAGNETYALQDLWRTLGPLPEQLGMDPEVLAGLGRIDPRNRDEGFGMTVVALRTSRRANGVSRRHGEVAREMWRGLWPRRRAHEVPIDYVTNGVHLPSWLSPPMHALLDRHLGQNWIRHADDPALWSDVEAIPDEALWEVRCELRRALVEWVRDRSVADRLARGESSDYVEAAAETFDPEVLTLGFARRVAAYKRLFLLAADPAQSAAALAAEPAAQIVLAGKAHPSDEPAKKLIQSLFALKRNADVGRRVIFLEDYEISVAVHLVTGCDVWINLPRPPLEASGTSGMKSVLNGGLQLSVLDGWWAEAFDGENGWGLAAEPAVSEDERDRRDARTFFDTLEKEVRPLFYERDAQGVPRGWLRRIKHSLRTLAPRFTATRMLADYERKIYVP